MHATRTSITRGAWLVSLTILLAALLPSLSHAVQASQGATFAEICSATGARLVRIDADGLVDAGVDRGDRSDRDSGPAAGPSSSMNCDYCATHHGAPLLPPAPASWTPPDTLRFESPQLFLVAPRPLFAWAPSHARAPPRSA